MKHIDTALFEKLSSSETDFFLILSHLLFLFPQMRNMEFEEWHYFLSWQMGNNQPWRRDENENDRLTNISFFISEICHFFLILEERQLQKNFSQNISWIAQCNLNGFSWKIDRSTWTTDTTRHLKNLRGLFQYYSHNLEYCDLI